MFWTHSLAKLVSLSLALQLSLFLTYFQNIGLVALGFEAEHLSYQNTCHTWTLVIPEHLPYQNTCITRTLVILEHLWHHNTCHTWFGVKHGQVWHLDCHTWKVFPPGIFPWTVAMSNLKLCHTCKIVKTWQLSQLHTCHIQTFLKSEHLLLLDSCHPCTVVTPVLKQDHLSLPDSYHKWILATNRYLPSCGTRTIAKCCQMWKWLSFLLYDTIPTNSLTDLLTMCCCSENPPWPQSFYSY